MAARPAVRSQSVVDRKVEARLHPGTQWTRFCDSATEVAHRIGRLGVQCRRREVVLVAGVAFIDESVQSLVSHASLPVQDRERPVWSKLAAEARVLQLAIRGGQRKRA